MIIKMDMENVFDRVHHSFLFDFVHKFGFVDSFIQWVKACIGSPWISPLVNGKPTPFFSEQKWIEARVPTFSSPLYHHGVFS
jgi:hypothetical protein